MTSDQQTKSLQSNLVIDRDAASRLGLTMAQIDNTLYDAFGQRQVSTIFSAINQYHVIMEIDPRYTKSPTMLDDIYISTAGGAAKGSATTNLPGGSVTRQAAAGETVTSAAAGSASLDRRAMPRPTRWPPRARARPPPAPPSRQHRRR